MAPGSGAGVNEESIKAKRAEVEKQKQAAADNLRKQLFGLKPDLNVMRSAVAEGEKWLKEDDTREDLKELLDDVREKLKGLEAAAAKKAEAERLKALAEKRDALSKALESFGSASPLEVNLADFRAAIEELTSLELPADLSAVEGLNTQATKAREAVAAADAAQTARRAAAEAQLAEQMALTLLMVEPSALRKACEDGVVAGVEPATLSAAQAKLADAETRDAAADKLREATQAAPEAADIAELRAAWLGASSTGVGADLLAAGLAQLQAATDAQAACALGGARLGAMLGQSAESLDTGALRAVRLEAAEAGVPPELLSKADALLLGAEKSQLTKDAATTCLLAMAAPRAPDAADVASMKELLPKAAAAGVSADVIELVTASMNEAQAALDSVMPAGGGTDDTSVRIGEVELHDAHIHRLHAANKRTASRAPQKQEAAVAAQAAAEEAERKAVEESAAAAAVAADADAATAAAVEALEEVDKKVVGEAGRPYDESEAARKALVAAREAAEQAHVALQAAKVREADAGWAIRKARGDTAWASQVAEAIAEAAKAAKEAPAAASQPRTTTPAPRTAPQPAQPAKGGCCGGGDPPIDPVAVNVKVEGTSTPAVNLPPLPRLVDELAWAPLMLPSGSKHQVELLLAFALEGVYKDAAVGEAVATAVCAGDPHCAVSGQVVTRLAESYKTGSMALTAGGIPSATAAKGKGGKTRRKSAVEVAVDAVKSMFTSGDKRGSSDDLLSKQWPGRVVNSDINDADVKLLLETWLVRMARAGGGGGGKGGGGAPKAAPAGGAPAGALSATLTRLMRPPHSELLKRLDVGLAPVLQGLLLRHHEAVAEAERAAAAKAAGGGGGGVDEDEEAEAAAAAALADVHSCIELLLGAGDKTHKELLPVWTAALGADAQTSPSVALAGAAKAFSASLFAHEKAYKPTATNGSEGAVGAENAHYEAVILSLVALFVASPGKLTGFQQIVPGVFDTYLALGTPLRLKLCQMLREGGMEATLVSRIETDDELVRQIFFWSESGMKLLCKTWVMHMDMGLLK